MKTMKTMKTLMLATVAALTLGAGAAMAQDGPSGYFSDYQGSRVPAARQAQPRQVQAGASDLNAGGSAFQIGPFHATPDRGVATVGGDGG